RELVEVRLAPAARQGAGLRRARGERRRAGQVQEPERVRADLIADTVDRQGVAAGRQVEHGVGAEVGGVRAAEEPIGDLVAVRVSRVWLPSALLLGSSTSMSSRCGVARLKV